MSENLDVLAKNFDKSRQDQLQFNRAYSAQTATFWQKRQEATGNDQ